MSLLLLLHGYGPEIKVPGYADGGTGSYSKTKGMKKKDAIQSRIRRDDDEVLEIIIQAFLME